MMMKKVNVALQLTNIREDELFEYQLSLGEIGVKDPIYYGMIPFSDEITGIENCAKYSAIVPFGAVKLIRLWQRGLVPPNFKVFYDEQRFDQLQYATALDWLLLNGEASYHTLGSVKDIPVKEEIFIKPTRDLKAFAGIIVEAGRTPGEEIFSRPQDSSLTDDEIVLIAPFRRISREYRNFVVGGKLIDSSIYKIGSKITYEVPSNEERKMLQSFFEVVASKYSPIDTYVVDFAMLENGEMTVIEYNCFNCAGMYSVDRRKVFKAVIDHVAKM